MVKKILRKRSRRNLKAKFASIPEGPYCYVFTGKTSEVMVNGIMVTALETKYCMFRKFYRGGTKCTAINLKCGEKDYQSPFNLLWDGCKECNFKTEYKEKQI